MLTNDKKIYETQLSLVRVYLACVILDSAIVYKLRYRTRAENQYDITLRPASSRFVTSEISEKTGHDEAAFTCERRESQLLFFFDRPLYASGITLYTKDKPRMLRINFFLWHNREDCNNLVYPSCRNLTRFDVAVFLFLQQVHCKLIANSS